MIATWIRGSDVDRRPLPSLVQMQMLPVSATPKLTPVMPMSALAGTPCRSTRRASCVICGTPATSSSVAPSFSLNTRAQSSFVLWRIGATMCDGLSLSSWTMYSPRSVSTTSMPSPSRTGLSSISSLTIDLPLTMDLTPRSRASRRMYSTASSPVSA